MDILKTIGWSSQIELSSQDLWGYNESTINQLSAWY